MATTGPSIIILAVLAALSRASNRIPAVVYVIPVEENQTAVVHCVSYFAETFFQLRDGNRTALGCEQCELRHVQHNCCKTVSWEEAANSISLRCTSKADGRWDPTDPYIPFIDVTVVRRVTDPTSELTDLEGRVIANSKNAYFCQHQTNVSHLTAGSHIGLGWTNRDGVFVPTSIDATMASFVGSTETNDNFPELLDHMSDNAKHKESQFSQYYSNDDFQFLWTSVDEKVELKKHNSNFTCNGTDYMLVEGSRCMTPSQRAIFVTTNCSVVERVFIVIGVIFLLLLSYIVFNVLMWLWDFAWNKSKGHEDDLDILISS